MYKMYFLSLLMVLCGCCRQTPAPTLTDISEETRQIGENFGCANAMREMRYENFTDARHLIITNSQEYDEKIIGTCHPDIDFDTYQLIITPVFVSKDVKTPRYKFYRNNENKGGYSLSLYVDGADKAGENAPAFFALLVPRKEKIQTLRITIGGSNDT